MNWPTPTCVSELRSFMGLLQFYDTFADHFAHVAFPLTELFKRMLHGSGMTCMIRLSMN
jgi:hypothetical protein